MTENLKPYLRRVARAAITDEDVRRDPAKAFQIAFRAARAAYFARIGKDEPERGEHSASDISRGDI